MASHNVPRATTLVSKTEQQRQEDKLEIDKYRALVEAVQTNIAKGLYNDETFDLTSRLLNRNPEYYTIWNARRRLLIYGTFSTSSDSLSPSMGSHSTSRIGERKRSFDDFSSSTANTSEDSQGIPPAQPLQTLGKNGIILEAIKRELEFVVPLLKKWPKCYWIWNHRLWLLRQAKERLDPTIARGFWEGELSLVQAMLFKDNRNFMGWGYRRTVVNELESPALAGTSMVEAEFAYTTKMITIHLSNFSAWHNRSKLIPRLLNERGAGDVERRAFLDEEFSIMRDALWTDPDDQSLWFYHQYLMSNIIEVTKDNTIVPDMSISERISFIGTQLTELREMVEGAEDCKWIYNALLDYTLASAKLQQREITEAERADVQEWLEDLTLDDCRDGRWQDLAAQLGIDLTIEE